MRFYNINCVGKIWLQRLSAPPSWVTADKGRLLYDIVADILYLGDDSAFSIVWTSGYQGTGTGLDADKLDGEEGTEFHRADLLDAGILPVARLGVSTETYDIDISGNAANATLAASATTAKYA